MKFPLFQRAKDAVLARDTQDRADKLLVESLRLLGQTCAKVAELIEAQRLERQGYERPGRFLERLDRHASSPEDRSGKTKP